MIRHFLKTILVLFLLQGSAWARTGAETVASEQTTATPALWEIRNPQKPGTLYLFGTAHLLPPDLNWQTESLEKAKKNIAKFVFELSPAEMANAANRQFIVQHGLLPPGQSLSQIIGQSLFDQLKKQVTAVPEEGLDHMRPWLAATIVAQQLAASSGLKADSGVERVLATEAESRQIPVDGLETFEEQIRALTALEGDGARELLSAALAEAQTAKQEFNKIVVAWSSGQEEELEEVFLKNIRAYPKAYNALIKKRNSAWVPRLAALLNERKPVFVAVGAAHLIGPDGVVAQMRAQGYRVKKIQP